MNPQLAYRRLKINFRKSSYLMVMTLFVMILLVSRYSSITIVSSRVIELTWVLTHRSPCRDDGKQPLLFAGIHKSVWNRRNRFYLLTRNKWILVIVCHKNEIAIFVRKCRAWGGVSWGKHTVSSDGTGSESITLAAQGLYLLWPPLMNFVNNRS